MGALRDRLDSPIGAGMLEPRLPEKPRIEQTAHEVRRRLSDCTPRQPDAYDLRETRRALARVEAGQVSLEEVDRKHIRRAPWVVFDTESASAHTLADDQEFARAYLSRLESEARSGSIVALATAFLWWYPSESNGFAVFRDAIRRLVHAARGPRAARLAEADDRCDLFGPHGVDTLARAVLDGSEELETVLESAALSGQLARSGFASAAFSAAVRITGARLRGENVLGQWLERLLKWSTTSDTSGPQLRYPAARTELADALLRPFQDGNPPSGAAERIKTYLLETYGDPRLDRSRWQGVSRYAEEVMLRWLVESTLEDFFRFVAHVASEDSEADRMWYYRHAFWRAYLNQGVIEQAWMVFGAQAAREAKRRFRDETGAYGQLRSGQNVKPNHAVLLLKVGELTISEWSHVGKYRIWRADNDFAPGFYCREYRRPDVVSNPDREGSHHGSESGNWQRKLAQAIREETGISIPMKELLPNARRKT